MDSLLSVVALGHRVSTRNGTNSGGAYQWGSRAAPRTRQFQPDHVIAAAAERLRSTPTIRLWPRLPLYPFSGRNVVSEPHIRPAVGSDLDASHCQPSVEEEHVSLPHRTACAAA